MASSTTTLKLKPVSRSSGLVINGHQYRLKAGQTSIELPLNDAATFRVVYPMLLADEPSTVVENHTPTAKKKAAPDVVADEAKDS